MKLFSVKKLIGKQLRQFQLESLFDQVLETLERDVGEEVVGQPRGKAVLNLHQVLTQPRPISVSSVSDLDPHFFKRNRALKERNLSIKKIFIYIKNQNRVYLNPDPQFFSNLGSVYRSAIFLRDVYYHVFVNSTYDVTYCTCW